MVGLRRTAAATVAVSAVAVLVPLLRGGVADAVPAARSDLAYVHPEGFAAMGVVETLVHTYDIAHGIQRDGSPPQDLSHRALLRLFPEVPVVDDASSTLLWATGRIGSAERPRRTSRRWHGAPRRRR
ncbi:hypothetical protein [Streptomyces pimonensis]|uniref:hypothetical protein n=1 Tax=Streptomyces pimonensis TaxID=2860288 RepID=UPI00352770A9